MQNAKTKNTVGPASTCGAASSSPAFPMAGVRPGLLSFRQSGIQVY